MQTSFLLLACHAIALRRRVLAIVIVIVIAMNRIALRVPSIR
jgi:hypothetical protein